MRVILFDGVCNLCNGLVNWIIRHDDHKQFMFASLQSAYGQKLVSKSGLKDSHMDSFILSDEDVIYERSTAALRVLKHLGGVYALAYGFIVIPAFIRNAVYNFVAKHRYRWFGKRESCMIPTGELTARFLE